MIWYIFLMDACINEIINYFCSFGSFITSKSKNNAKNDLLLKKIMPMKNKFITSKNLMIL